jgi:hypothetical protein
MMGICYMLLASVLALVDLQSTTPPLCSAFTQLQPSTLVHQSTTRRSHHTSFDISRGSSRRSSGGRISSKLDMIPSTEVQQQLSTSISTITSSLLLSDDGSVESWRQYVPLAVSVGVILDILLGSPVANLALAPMKRASEQGSGSDSNRNGGEDKALSRSKERVDSEAIAQAALDKAMGTLELKRFLEENKTPEQKYEDVRKKIDRQMQELED